MLASVHPQLYLYYLEQCYSQELSSDVRTGKPEGLSRNLCLLLQEACCCEA